MRDTGEIYGLQDRVCRMVFAETQGTFYLTGGTALQRFCGEVRTSEDLDFFTNGKPLFRKAYHRIREALRESGFHLREEILARDFIRIVAEEKPRVNLVHDGVFRYGTSWVLPSGYRLDNLGNIPTNKVGTVVDREEPKDLVNLVLIASLRSCSWPEIVEVALKKPLVSVDALSEKMVTFPVALLRFVRFPDPHFAAAIPFLLPKVIADIGKGGENSLGRDKPGIFTFSPRVSE